MILDSDALVDRRRLKRRLTVWRIVAVVAGVAAVIAAFGRWGGLAERAHVARLSVAGIIVDDVRRDQALAEIADDDAVRALIVRIDSPGGTVVGGEALYRNLRLVAERKPVVAVMGEVATSAAYMTALAGDRIIAREGTITGSIGVVLQTADVTGLLDRIGVKPDSVKSTPLKAQPNPLETFTPEGREAAAELVGDLYRMFVGLVEERRRLGRDETLVLADGRVFTGRQAFANGLIDALGGEREARQWLEQAHAVGTKVPVRDVRVGRRDAWVLDLLSGMFGKAFFFERLSLDGLISLWHHDS
ncbi:MAG: signal peptide peptidase SppA [Rhodospirillales bacterium]